MNRIGLASLLFVGFTLTAWATQPLPFDRVIIFGDSLSDTGDIPEPPDFKNGSATVPMNLYVPISNPVATSLYGTTFSIPQKASAHWNYPTTDFLANASLPTGTHQGTIDGQPKAFFSINWPEFFVYNALPSTAKLIPWTTLWTSQSPISTTTSINYAWIGAMSVNEFTYITDTDYGFDNTPYSEQEIFDRQNDCRNGLPACTGTEHVRIPGVVKQVDFYTQDLANHKLPTDDNTAYILYIGGNDIGNDMVLDINDMVAGLENSPFWNDPSKEPFGKHMTDDVGTTDIPGNITTHIKMAVDELIQKDHAKHIYVVSYFHLGDTAEAYKKAAPYFMYWALKNFMNGSMDTYNLNLVNTFSTDQYKSIVSVIPVADAINAAGETEGSSFKDSVDNGLACQDVMATSTTANPSIDNCNYNGTETYFEWNDVHFTTAINQMTAYEIYRDIAQGLTVNAASEKAKATQEFLAAKKTI